MAVKKSGDRAVGVTGTRLSIVAGWLALRSSSRFHAVAVDSASNVGPLKEL
jgi:hypothetical protein